MRRAFRGKMCAYCAVRPAETDDHVLGRGFFPGNLRGDLPQVPACAQCNAEKSDLERYAMTVLPMGSADSRVQQYAVGKFGRRLDNDNRLRKDLQSGIQTVRWLEPCGTEHPGMALSVDDARLSKLYEMIAKGLIHHHVGRPLPGDYSLTVLSLTQAGITLFRHHILSLSPEQFKNCSLADGLFRYECTFSQQDPLFSAWVFELYGILNICGLTQEGELQRVWPAVLALPPGNDDLAEGLRSVLCGSSQL